MIKNMFHWEKTDNPVIKPQERLSWAKTIGLGAQHVVAMFGATFLVPLLTGFSPATTLFFSAIATVLFLLITRNRVPSYLGSSFAFIAPIGVACGLDGGGEGYALFGVAATGVLLMVIGVVVHFAGAAWINKLMPPVVNGTIVAIIGLNLAPSAWDNFSSAPITAAVTLVAILLISQIPGIVGRLSILLGVAVGYIFAVIRGEVDFGAINDAAWVGFPQFQTPQVNFAVLAMFLPVVLVLVAENIGHLKSVAAMTGEDLDPYAGRALIADGLGTLIAGAGGGSGTTTYAENIGVMAATKVYSTAAYWVAGGFAFILALCPKFGAAVATVPPGVLGGAATLLYGMIGMLGVRIYLDNHVDFKKNTNLYAAAVPMIIGIANFTFSAGDVTFNGIAIGAFGSIIIYHVLNFIETRTSKKKKGSSDATEGN
jgi:uracil-xanthine permease